MLSVFMFSILSDSGDLTKNPVIVYAEESSAVVGVVADVKSRVCRNTCAGVSVKNLYF
jgi:hypothetical protein